MRQRRSIIAAILITFLFAITAAGVENVSIKEWELPAQKSLPHDPAVGVDGSLWYTGMQSNTLGRLDPSNGQIKEYHLKTPDSGPHGITSDKNGNIWFTANFKGYIGKLDLQTGNISEYPMPDRAAKDPHTLVFDGAGILWFTVQEGNFVGKLDPKSGVIALKPSPTQNSRPYGMTINSKGVPFYCEFGSNKIGKIDPVTMQITEYVLPQGARPRRLAVGRDDMIFYTDFQRGYLGVLDPNTGRAREWQSPGGSDSKPYGIAITPDGTVWYSESGVQPNTIVHFDPGTKHFEKWNIPSGGGVVRNMTATPDGNIYIACSGVNKVGIVRVEK